ncbi:MAG: hypothetical protein NTW27_09000 [Deltaproteobacteria bacterium]|nr:hypothetical protein [Deltaproteobacteria bacterium]
MNIFDDNKALAIILYLASKEKGIDLYKLHVEKLVEKIRSCRSISPKIKKWFPVSLN